MPINFGGEIMKVILAEDLSSSPVAPFSDLGRSISRASLTRKKKIMNDLVYMAKRVTKLAYELQKYVIMEGSEKDCDGLVCEVSEMNGAIRSLEKSLVEASNKLE